MRLSEFFKLGKTQFELDFIDILLDTDISLFIDPYALAKRNDLFSMKCSNIIVNFFQRIIDDIKNGDYASAKYNLNRLNEPNETRLGLSSSKPKGKGVSGKQSNDVFERLKISKAVTTGFLKDLSDCELVIPGISRDKISDIVTNIIRLELIEYTKQQCHTYNIPTFKVSSGKYWNSLNGKWEIKYDNLPIYKNTRIILVPKAIVRFTLEYNHQKYYNNFVLNFLQEENISAGTSLVRLLKNGKKVVYKKDLKNDPRFKLTKEFLFKFSEEHPEVLKDYVESLTQTIPSLTNEELEKKQHYPVSFNYDKLKNKLMQINSGQGSADNYHEAIIGILEAIFYPNLYSPNKEERIHNGRKIIDITYLNAAKNGFFEFLVNNHIHCPFVICECKNYNDDPNNPELDQLSGRFSPRRGRFGLLLCRKIENRELMEKKCRDTVDDDRGYIIALDDNDLIQLLEYKKRNDIKAIDEFLTNKYKKLVM
ncbi:hypothetical protein A3A46_04550 [Candidatus Roizmanbacteria bacterium RIFCSPLOWO2_01_FULL_37_13]|uniref:Restriction endonuclease type IV Mrr domain-containing protein n=1 Tax=Candidatus Roizmanbacteria bacterium RIFCSPHIGHO2_02_FULL_38_11 TaxID=1802039 RepID=A0A1F7H2Q5_9BACT|nr:MAG: hypothetical protein A3C25_02515 [Candidatus Roizmanbacteria bacterium RIFCSPHIGHO2_02_FULL_38_11]OGK42994.1 MAG: hypothetical protein A3A46_04550 [Candidatus Roizmanbacteria bacterium RIFCSPLOWO2_01_FULL_37_13]